MRDYFDRAPGINKAREVEQQLELFEKNPDKFVSNFKQNLPNEGEVKSEMWKLLNEIGIFASDKREGEKMPYSYYDLDKLKNLLKEELEKRKAA